MFQKKYCNNCILIVFLLEVFNISFKNFNKKLKSFISIQFER